jgi:hypothetical protein
MTWPLDCGAVPAPNAMSHVKTNKKTRAIKNRISAPQLLPASYQTARFGDIMMAQLLYNTNRNLLTSFEKRHPCSKPPPT